MKPEDWKRVRALIEEALDLPDADAAARRSFVEAATADDPSLRAEALRLLAIEVTQGFLDPPTATPAAQGIQPGQELGHFRIVRALGAGGMGTVYEAEQRDPERRVALKVLGQASAEGIRRFETEVRTLASLRHPNVAQVYDAGTASLGGMELPWFAMELVEDARDIVTWVREEGASRAERLALFRDLCEAVRHGHARAVLHRDLKPSNVLVDREGHVKLIDFGIARALEDPDADENTQTGGLVGTPQYMAPEQFSLASVELDVRCDVYALGVLLYQLLCDRAPFDLAGQSLTSIARTVREEEPARPSSIDRSLAGDLEWILLRALEKDRDRRYDGVSAFLDDLERHERHEPVSAGPPSTAYRLKKFARRNLVLVSVSAALLFGLILAATGTTLGMFQARAAEREASQEADKNALVVDLVGGLFDGIDDTIQGRDVRVADLLDAAVLEFDAEVATDPEVELAFRTMLGSVYHRLDLYEAASLQLERAHELVNLLPADEVSKEQRREVELLLGGCMTRTGRVEEGDAMLRAVLAEATADEDFELQKDALELLLFMLVDRGASGEEILELAARMEELARETNDEKAELSALRSTSSAYSALDRYDEAVEASRLAWESSVGIYGEDSLPAADSIRAYAYTVHNSASFGRAVRDDDAEYVKRRAAEFERADELYVLAIELNRQHYGRTHTNTLTTLGNRAALASHRGDQRTAIQMLREIVDAYDEREEDPTSQFASTVHNLAMTLHFARDFEGADAVFERAVRMAEELMSDDNMHLHVFRLHWGMNDARRGEWERGELRMLEAVEALEQLLPEDHSTLQKAIAKVANSYKVVQDYDSAAFWSERLSGP